MNTRDLPSEFMLAAMSAVKEAFPESKALRLGSESCEYDGISVNFKPSNISNRSFTEFYVNFVPKQNDGLSVISQFYDCLSDEYESLMFVYCYSDLKIWMDMTNKQVDRPAKGGAELEVVAEKLLPVFQRCFPSF